MQFLNTGQKALVSLRYLQRAGYVLSSPLDHTVRSCHGSGTLTPAVGVMCGGQRMKQKARTETPSAPP